MNVIVHALVSPLGTCLLLLALAALLAGVLRRQRLAVVCACVGVGWLLAWSTAAVPQWVQARLEAPFPAQPLEAVPTAQAIVVLGGAIGAPVLGGLYADLSDASDRVWHAARLYKAGKAPVLVLSGGTNPAVNRTSEADAMQGFLLDMGVPASAMLLEGASRTTQENARFSAAMLQQRGITRVLLVTSALHMPRALAIFSAEGLHVLPAATDHARPQPLGRWQAWVPDAGTLATSSRVLREVVGRLLLAP